MIPPCGNFNGVDYTFILAEKQGKLGLKSQKMQDEKGRKFIISAKRKQKRDGSLRSRPKETLND
jgi:hypothetical protein